MNQKLSVQWIALMIVCFAIAVFCTMRYVFDDTAIIVDDDTPLLNSQEIIVESNDKMEINATDMNSGTISAKYTGNTGKKIKIQISKGDKTYTYDLNNGGVSETFILSEGNGSYTVRVLEHVEGTKYSPIGSTILEVTIANEYAPFLASNQYVNFKPDSAVALKAAELTKDCATELDKITAIYNYVTENFTYDYDKAATVQSGYVPDVDAILNSKTGICFDYAAVMSAMLRSQNIPTKMVFGYVGEVYHAWVNVYTSETGWVQEAMFFNGSNWELADPTFASSGHYTEKHSYSSKFAY